MEAFERCPRCRRKRAGFAVYRCPDCGAGFCAGCDEDETDDQPEASVRWLAAAALEAWLDSCPVCTGAVGDGDQVGVIAGPAAGRQDADK